MKSINRREFLFQMGATGVGLLSLSKALPLCAALISEKGSLVIADGPEGPMVSLPGTIVKMSTPIPGSIKIWSVATGLTKSIPVPFLGHGIIVHPKKKNMLVTFQKWGNNGAEIRIEDAKSIQSISASDGKLYFGHGTFSSDGSSLLTPEMDYRKFEGRLVIRDSSNYKIIEEYSTHGILPHDCHLVDNGKTLLVANDAEAEGKRDGPGSSLVWINLKNGKLEHSYRAPKSFERMTHFKVTDDGWILVCGIVRDHSNKGPKPGLVIAFDPSGKASVLEGQDKPLVGECLSLVTLEDQGVVAVTCPLSDRIFFWNYREKRFLRSITLNQPKGLALSNDKKQIFVTEAKTKTIVAVESKTFEVSKVASGQAIGGAGSHLSRLNLEIYGI